MPSFEFVDTVNDVQRRWSVAEREMYGIVFCVKAARFFIGGGVPCFLRTDHRALPFQAKERASPKVERASPKVERWK